MVILVIDENRVLALECKLEPPVPAHPHGPVPLQADLEWVQGDAGAFILPGQVAASRAEKVDVMNLQVFQSVADLTAPSTAIKNLPV